MGWCWRRLRWIAWELREASTEYYLDLQQQSSVLVDTRAWSGDRFQDDFGVVLVALDDVVGGKRGPVWIRVAQEAVVVADHGGNVQDCCGRPVGGGSGCSQIVSRIEGFVAEAVAWLGVRVGPCRRVVVDGLNPTKVPKVSQDSSLWFFDPVLFDPVREVGRRRAVASGYDFLERTAFRTVLRDTPIDPAMPRIDFL